MSPPSSISPSSSAAHIPTSASSPSRNPSSLSIPTASSASSVDQSPTTPTNAAATPVDLRSVANLDQYRITPVSAASVDSSLAKDEQALRDLNATDVHKQQASNPNMGNVAEQSALDQVLSGILTMQKEVSISIKQLCISDLAARMERSQQDMESDHCPPLLIKSSPDCMSEWTLLRVKTRPWHAGTRFSTR